MEAVVDMAMAKREDAGDPHVGVCLTTAELV